MTALKVFWSMSLVLLASSSELRAEGIRLAPSSAAVQSVILQYIPNGFPKGHPNPRVELIEAVRSAFPKIDIRITSDLPLDELWKQEPQLQTMVNAAVYLPGKGNHNEIQDPFELAWDYDRKLPVVFQFAGYDDYRPALALWPQARIFTVPSTRPARVPRPSGGSRTAGGNLEVLPDATPVMGSDSAEDAILYFRKTAGRVVLVDSGWTGSGDVDEMFLWTEDPRHQATCILFQLDVEGGRHFLTKDELAAWQTEELRERLALNKLLAPQLPVTEAALKKMRAEILSDRKRLVQGQEGITEIERRIETSGDTIMSELSMKNCRRVKLPVIYQRESGERKDGPALYSMAFENPVNSLVIEDQVFALRPEFPAERRAAEKIFTANGFRVHWISANGFNKAGGNVHCNSNTQRVPLPTNKIIGGDGGDGNGGSGAGNH